MTTKSFAVRSFPPDELRTVKNKVLNWLQRFGTFSFFDNNLYNNEPVRYELLAAGGIAQRVANLDDLQGAWLFGHANYDYKNFLEPCLASSKPANTGFGDSFWYQPQVVFYINHREHALRIESYDLEAEIILYEILALPLPVYFAKPPRIEWDYFFTKESYVSAVDCIKHHIASGDCYEMNFCSGAQAENVVLDPLRLFMLLNKNNPAPFAALYRNEGSWLICASPERYLHKKGNELICQPIKGTVKRGKDDTEDEALKWQLLHDPKERAENIMIVDLVRNDLSRCAALGSVKVTELLGVYSFPQVHQLISTIVAQLAPGSTLKAAFDAAFPMGSMTGAPKVKVMQLTDKYEPCRRELFSGTVGYRNPAGDADFNVVIRSLLYNGATRYLRYQTGGAITFDSNPEAEWAETRLKAQALEQLFIQE
ncbi:MAG: anthranilate synthase component I family protein [Edaphocola sp.]